MFLAVHTAINGVQNAITPARLRKIEECAAEKPFACLGKCQANWIIHSTGDHDFQLAAVGASPIDMGGPRLKRFAVTQFVLLRRKRSLTPIEKTVGPKVRAMQIISATFN